MLSIWNAFKTNVPTNFTTSETYVSNGTQKTRVAFMKIFDIVIKHIVFYPTSGSLSYLWGFGSLAGLLLAVQLITGVILAMHYQPSSTLAFESVLRIVNDVPNGWCLRSVHANGASFFFLVVYIHMGRNLYYGSFLGPRAWVWLTGLIIFLLMMGAGFIGYCLPWGQMSLWGATVITNLLSVLIWPLDIIIVEWLWGGFTVTGITLNRFFSLHYLLPFVILALVMAHFYFLHDVSSGNPQGLEPTKDLAKLPFYTYFYNKDFAGFLLLMTLFLTVVTFYPTALGHSDNFIKANPFVTPAHIVPEWYFLPFYAILRSISNKVIGVVAMLVSAAFVSLFSYVTYNIWLIDTEVKRVVADLPVSKILYWVFVANFLFLGYIGACPIEAPYYELGQISAIFFFVYWFLAPFIHAVENLIVHYMFLHLPDNLKK